MVQSARLTTQHLPNKLCCWEKQELKQKKKQLKQLLVVNHYLADFISILTVLPMSQIPFSDTSMHSKVSFGALRVFVCGILVLLLELALYEQCCGPVTFWYGSGSVVPYL